MSGRRTRAAVVALLAGLVIALVGAPASAQGGYVPITGSGSTWSENAITQWVNNVEQYGIQVNYSGTGSSDGRNQFKAGQGHFAVSEIEYGLTDAGVTDFPPSRKFAYMPIVAGGTSFMYNLKVGGQPVTNLRLSGATVAGIFTGTITSWDDPAIKADNPALALPARKIVPVVRSDGSGTTAQFTRWLSSQHAQAWNAFCAANGRATPCGFTSNYPQAPGFIGKARSDGVAGFVKQGSSDGAITYVEYSYAAPLPVAKLLNAAGYYVAPTAQNVAVGLQSATINQTDLTQQLEGVYVSPDARTYPLSSYSYMIVPLEPGGQFSATQGKTLARFAAYFLCEGQRGVDRIGYSPLPRNLVEAGMNVVRQIPGIDAETQGLAGDLSRCNNPTFSPDGTNVLARDAPQPPECDRKGASAQCDAEGRPAAPQPGSAGAPAAAAADPNAAAAAQPSAAADPAAAAAAATTAAAASGAAVVDPDTGEVLSADGGAGGPSSVAGVPVELASSPVDGIETALVVMAVVLLAAVAIVPPLLGRALDPRSRR